MSHLGRLAVAILFGAAIWLTGCSKGGGEQPRKSVVVYTALDRVFSEPILRRFEQDSGIEVLPVYDAESAKTTGLVNRLIQRRDRPDCDVFWNNEIVQTQRLAAMGLLEPYASPQAARIPAAFRDGQDRWTGFAARMRLIIYNKDLVRGQPPAGLADFVDPARRGQGAIARPFFGTTLTHVAVLHQQWGPDRLRQFLRAARENQVAWCAGNASVRDMVASGERAFGLTDTDDAYEAMQTGKPVGVCVPDRATGALLIPNTVAVVAGCPHPQEARKLVDFLLSAEVERTLAESASSQIPLGTDLAGLPTPWADLLKDQPFAPMDVGSTAGAMEAVVQLLRDENLDQ
jgi:iron(III) transport system substrate-binding protein